ncbi:uncharacterized protein LOC6578981 [Drosophila mojavensis]|uniref:Uncharacterized protein n=1 Tax=Drosophila mojavensis TaxID=7230 RepID=B4KMS1_DROMO|nr:uncharacterized protein LOC6578981 [Drosophila mojavensis]EDW08813.1 uncharacterized protein Dmoj_GI20158 [Drosophila mojavensis]
MLKRFFCMSLNTAGVVIGWLGIVGSLLGIILLSTILKFNDDIVKALDLKTSSGDDQMHLAIVIGCSVYLGFILLNLPSSALLVLGTKKERHLMLLPWLINSAVGLAFNIVYHLVVLNVVIYAGKDIRSLVAVLIQIALILALQIYIYMGIYSLFKQIQKTRAQQRPLTTATPGMTVPNQGNTYPSYTKN